MGQLIVGLIITSIVIIIDIYFGKDRDPLSIFLVFLISTLLIVLIGSVVGVIGGYILSRDEENYHFEETTYILVEHQDTFLTLTRNTDGDVNYNYIYINEKGQIFSDFININSDIFFEYSEVLSPSIHIYKATYNNKKNENWFIKPTEEKFKLILPRDSITNILY